MNLSLIGNENVFVEEVASMEEGKKKKTAKEMDFSPITNVTILI